MDDRKLQRINELARKSKAEGLTETERQEQAELRREYIEAVRRNLRGQLDNIDIISKDGKIENLGEKYGKKGNKNAGFCAEEADHCRGDRREKRPDL